MIHYRFALRLLAVFIVPRAIRASWVAEWNSELWYFADSLPEAANWLDRQDSIATFCRGAIDDARYLREARRPSHTPAANSAVACAGWVAFAALVAMAAAYGLPNVRTAMLSPVYRAHESVAIAPSEFRPGASMALGTVRSWQKRSQRLFSEFAFYTPMTVASEGRSLRIARASANVLSLLGVPVLHAQADDSQAALILTASAFRDRFGEDIGLIGRRLRVGDQDVRVAGVVPDEAAPNGLKLDAWLLLPAAAADALPGKTPVHLLARRMTPHPMTLPQGWTMTVRGISSDTETDYDCTVVPPARADVWKLFLFAVFLGLLALPATTSLSLGEYAARPANLPWTSTLRRWLFLGVKIGCVMPLVYFVSLVTAYSVRFASTETSQYVHLVTAFGLTLFLLRWALRDQRRRCPVCLGRLTCPARVGEPSRNFLSWNGTELICAGGHGFLHVPEMATSWFGTQRWLHLDPSWSGLFLRT